MTQTSFSAAEVSVLVVQKKTPDSRFARAPIRVCGPAAVHYLRERQFHRPLHADIMRRNSPRKFSCVRRDTFISLSRIAHRQQCKRGHLMPRLNAIVALRFAV